MPCKPPGRAFWLRSPSVSPSSALRPLFWEHEGNRAIRLGQWKLVSKHPGGWELYDIAIDRAEQRDLAAQHPDRVRELSAQWDTWAKRALVLPLPVNSTAGKAAKKKTAAKIQE